MVCHLPFPILFYIFIPHQFDKMGVTGGCQRMMTVVPAANTSLENPPICTNLTYPAGILNVEGTDHTGLLYVFNTYPLCLLIDVSIDHNMAGLIK